MSAMMLAIVKGLRPANFQRALLYDILQHFVREKLWRSLSQIFSHPTSKGHMFEDERPRGETRLTLCSTHDVLVGCDLMTLWESRLVRSYNTALCMVTIR